MTPEKMHVQARRLCCALLESFAMLSIHGEFKESRTQYNVRSFWTFDVWFFTITIPHDEPAMTTHETAAEPHSKRQHQSKRL